ncbi:MAG TPA: hypothetical protein VL633_08435 [Bacteroidota bacterium]|nr:hypothetical protein [Bacteroidota bacterium]
MAPASVLGNYDYVAFDSTGTPAVRGGLRITSRDSGLIKGVWEFASTDSVMNYGPQVGRGIFAGFIDDDSTVTINLNPGWADNNVFLTGKINGPLIEGKWSWDTIIGETNKGTFKARKLLLAV